MKDKINPPTRADVIAALYEYKRTLEVFRIKRTPSLYDDTTVFRAMTQYGTEMVLLALRGARFEPRREGFDPAVYCSLGRILDHDNVERFANLGSRQTEPEVEFPADSSKDRAQIAEALRRIKGG